MARKIEVEIVGDSRSLQRALGQAGQSGSRFGSAISKVGRLAVLGMGAAAGAAGFAGVKMIGLASDAGEVESKFKIIFGKTVPRLTKNIDAFAKATGASRFELIAQTADLGALLKPIIGNTREAGKMSVAVAKLATDLGSFNNVPVEEALLAIRSGLVGEAEPLRRFGVLLNEAAVKAEALRLGLVKEGEELTEAQKVQARYSLVMQQTTLAQGDAVRTSGSFANQLKRLKNQVRDTATDMGRRFLPIASQVLDFLNRLSMAKGLTAKVGIVFRGLSGALKDLRERVSDALFGSFKTIAVGPRGSQIERVFVPGLIARIQEGLSNVNWDGVGRKMGAGISKSIRITAEFLGNLLTQAEAFISANLGRFAELGAMMVVGIFAKLLDPGFWARHWKLALAVGVGIFPIGRIVGLGKTIVGALLGPLARLLPSGFRGIGGKAIDAILTPLGKLPGRVQGIILRVISVGGQLLSWIGGKLQAALKKIPPWIRTAFRIGAVLTIIGAIQTFIGWINTAIGKLGELRTAINNLPGAGVLGSLPGVGLLFGGRKALGGPVSASRSYLVGERGPEFFTPNRSGVITPNSRLAGASGGTVVFNFPHYVGDQRQLIGALKEAVDGYRRSNGGQDPW